MHRQVVPPTMSHPRICINVRFANCCFYKLQASKNRPQEVQEAANILSASKSCFQHTALDYVNYITLVQSRKVPSILSTVSRKLILINCCGQKLKAQAH